MQQQRRTFLITERRDERKAIHVQDIQEIKGLIERVTMHGLINNIYI